MLNPIKSPSKNTTPKAREKKDSELSFVGDKLPECFNVSVIMESKPSSHPWADEVWDASGVVATSADATDPIENQVKIIDQGDTKQFIYSDTKIRLFIDECESYYHNMMSPKPSCYIVARAQDEEGNDTDIPIPFLVTLSFDEAHAYLESDDRVYAVAIPAELYLWMEAYVLENYVAEKRVKRKRVDWKKGDKRNSSSHEPVFDGPPIKTAEDKGKPDA